MALVVMGAGNASVNGVYEVDGGAAAESEQATEEDLQQLFSRMGARFTQMVQGMAMKDKLTEDLQQRLSRMETSLTQMVGEMAKKDKVTKDLQQHINEMEARLTQTVEEMLKKERLTQERQRRKQLQGQLFVVDAHISGLEAELARKALPLLGRSGTTEPSAAVSGPDAPHSPGMAPSQGPAAATGEAAEPAAIGSVALLFPGEGSQHMKMLENSQGLAAVQEMLAKAKEILGWDVSQICQSGPEQDLDKIRICQPAMCIANLAAVERLKVDSPGKVDEVKAVAGLSLGEYSALIFAGVLTFEDGVKLVKLGGEAMQEAAAASRQAACSVAGLEQSKLEELCAASKGPGDTCQITAILFPKGFQCAGSEGAITKLVEVASHAGALQAKMLKPGGAFHTGLMQPAKEKLLQALQEAEARMQPPRVDLYMNLTGERIAAGTPPVQFIPLLADQLCNPVQWERSVQNMIQDGISEFHECGPMRQLKALMKRIDANMFNKTYNSSP